MAFKLYKASGARVPDIVSDIGAGATLAGSIASDASYQLNGRLLFLDPAAGDLEIGVTGSAVAGVCVVEYKGSNGSQYAAASGGATATFPNGLVAGTAIPFLPVTGTVPIIADVSGSPAVGAIQVGEDIDIAAGGLTLEDASVNDDFHVVKVIDDGTNITKVVGFFKTPGYFTA